MLELVEVPMITPLCPVKISGSEDELFENTMPDEAFTPIEPYPAPQQGVRKPRKMRRDFIYGVRANDGITAVAVTTPPAIVVVAGCPPATNADCVFA